MFPFLVIYRTAKGADWKIGSKHHTLAAAEAAALQHIGACQQAGAYAEAFTSIPLPPTWEHSKGAQ